MKIYSKEENLANEILLSINNRISLADFNNLHFEIISDFYNKDILLSYVFKNNICITKVEECLSDIGINRKFVDNSNPNQKRYLAIFQTNTIL